MSSPGARQRRRRQQYQAPRTRAELAVAVGASVAIVGATALMIWLLRPGGLADRQPRSSWLVGGGIIAAIVAVYVLRPSSRLKVDRKIALPASLGGILVVAVVLGIAWPGGLLRHTPPVVTPPPVQTSASTTTAPGGSTTTAAGGSTTVPTTTAPGSSTTAPSSTTGNASTTIPANSTTSTGP
jgi:hypothetical protein